MRRLLVLLAIVALAYACGSPSESTETATPDNTAIEFTAETTGGGQIDMADYAGQPLALWFWSPW